MKHIVKLSVLFIQEDSAWVGQCLEHDIAAQGKTIEEAKNSLSHTLAAQMMLDARDGKTPLAQIKPAPEYYKQKFEGAERLRYTLMLDQYETYGASVEDARMAVA